MDNSLSNSIAEQITSQIISGELKPNEKLVELEYAEEFGTSRAPVREAIYLLATEGLLERIPRKGAIVKEYGKNEIYDLLEIRNMLENMALKRIETNGVNHRLLEEMSQLLEKMKTTEDIVEYTQLNHSFHMCLVRMSKSETIKNMYLRLGKPLLRIQGLSFSREGNIKKSIKEHEMIIQLLHEGNLERLKEILVKHNEDVIGSIQKELDS